MVSGKPYSILHIFLVCVTIRDGEVKREVKAQTNGEHNNRRFDHAQLPAYI